MLTLNNDIDVDAINEKLISKSHKIYRTLAAAKLTNIQEELRSQIQAKNLKRIENELNELNLNIGVATNKFYVNTEKQNVDQIECQIKCYDRLDTKLTSVKTELTMFHSQLDRLHAEKELLDKKTISDNEYKRNINQAQENVRRLENRLYTIKLCEGNHLQWNRHLRTIAKQIIHERMLFNYLYKKIVDRLCVKKKLLVNLVDQAVLALDGCTDLCKRIIMLKNKADEDLHLHVNEMKNLMLTINVNERKYKFFENKGNYIEIRELNAVECKRRELFKKRHTQNIERFHRILDETKQITNETECEFVIKKFNKYENDFFSYYTYLNELNFHIENMIGESADAARNLSKKIVANTQLDGDTRSYNLQHWQERFKTENDITGRKRASLTKLQSDLDANFERMKELFVVLGCPKNPQNEEINNENITVHNYVTFLSIIEVRLKEVLSHVYYLERQKDRRQSDAFVVRDVEVNEARPIERGVLNNLIHQCAECIAAESTQVGRHAVQPVEEDNLMQMIKDIRPHEIQHRMHNINKCGIPRSHMLYVKHLQNS